MSTEDQTLLVRVLKLRDEEGDFLYSLEGQERVSVSAELRGEEQESHSLPAQHGIKRGKELLWATDGNQLRWTQTTQTFHDIKSTQPTMKFVLKTKEQDCGFFLVDLRNLPHYDGGDQSWSQEWQNSSLEFQQEIKVNQLHGVYVLVSAVIQPSSTAREPGQGIRESTTSVASAITLPPHYDLEAKANSMQRFTFSITILSTRNLESLLTSIIVSNKDEDYKPSVWFSWSVLDYTIQTAEFDPTSLGKGHSFEAATDSLLFKCSEVGMLNLLEEMSSMRLFLCTKGYPLGMAEIPLPEHLGNLPYQARGWFGLDSLQSSEGEHSASFPEPCVEASFEVRASGRVSDQEARINPEDNECSSESQYDDDSFVEDVNDGGEEALKSTHSHPLLLLKGKDHKKSLSSERTVTDSMDSDECGEDKEDLLDQEVDEYEERRTRLCLQVKSLRPLLRPVRASIQFSYPALGVGTAVRTQTAWTEANIETAINGAIATYDCNISTKRLKEVFAKDDFVVQVLSRSHLGVVKFGDASVSLLKLFKKRPHSFLCPVSRKSFESLAEYRRHRQQMIALRNAGKAQRVPPLHPVTLRVLDRYVPVLSASSKGVDTVGRVHLVLSLEDLGPSHDLLSGSAPARSIVPSREQFGQSQSQADPHGPHHPSSHSHGEEREAAWERWRQQEEEKWRSALQQREQQLRARLEAEAAESLSQRADDLKRAQEEVGRLEVRLRSSLEAVERQKVHLEGKQDQMNAKLAQKTSEVELLQRRVRDEAKSRVEVVERQKSQLEGEVAALREQLTRVTRRAEEAEKDFEVYKRHLRSMPESSLREESARLKAQVGELRAEVERERRLRGEKELEKEHHRAQVHRLAVALKRERERSSALARQELEQLRLEFLSREERYVLDGDRDELRTIRQELSNLRILEASKHSPANDDNRSCEVNRIRTVRPIMSDPLGTSSSSSADNFGRMSRLNELRRELMESGMYSEEDPMIAELDGAIKHCEVHIAESRIFGGSLESK